MSDQPICVLIHGPSGSGKTQVARTIATSEGVQRLERINNTNVIWDYKALSSPLGELFTTKTTIKGDDEESRQLWMILHILEDLFPYNSISFGELYNLIMAIYAYPLELKTNDQGDLVRDRNFMTNVADMCHALYFNPFAKHLIRKIRAESSLSDVIDGNPSQRIIVVPDLRLVRELEAFEQSDFSLIKIKFDISHDLQVERLIKRDSDPLTPEQLQHETQLSEFHDDDFDIVIKADNLSLADQISMTKDYIIQQSQLK